MKKKTIVIIALVVSLLLVGGVAMASFDENGNFINPFSTILGEKVSSGELTQAEVDTFNKVFESIDAAGGAMRQRGGMLGGRSETGLFANSEAMAEYTAQIQVKIDEVFAGLVTNNVLTQEQVDSLNPFARGAGFNVEGTLGDLTDEQCDAVEAAMTEVHEYMSGLKAELSEAGLIGANPRMTLDGSNKGGGVRGRQN